MKKNFIFLLLLCVMLLGACAEETAHTDKTNTRKLTTADYMPSQNTENDIRIDKKYEVTPYISEGFFTVRIADGEKRKTAFMDLNGNILGDKFYRNEYGFFNDGLACVFDLDGETYFINTKGESAITSVDGRKIIGAQPFMNGLTLVSFSKNLSDNDFACINTKGEIIEKPPITHSGKRVFTDDEMNVAPMSHERYTFYQQLLEKNADQEFPPQFGIYDLKENKKVTEPIYSYHQFPNFVGDKTVVVKDGDVLILDVAQNKVIKNLTKEYGFVALEDERLRPINHLTEEGMALNFKDKDSIIVDTNGELLFDTGRGVAKLSSIVDGKIIYLIENKFGIMNINNKTLLGNEFEETSNIYNNTVLLKKDGQWMIHKLE